MKLQLIHVLHAYVDEREMEQDPRAVHTGA